MEGPVNGHIYATIGSIKLHQAHLIMSSPLPNNIDNNHHHRSSQSHRHQQISPNNVNSKRSNQSLHDNRSQQQQPPPRNHSSRKYEDNEAVYYSSSQESNSSKRVAPMWSPSSETTANKKYEILSQHYTGSHRSTTAQSEIERIDDLLHELTPRLNDSPSEYLRRRRQSFSNSSKTTTFEGRQRQDTFIQGFSPTSPSDRLNDRNDVASNCDDQPVPSITGATKDSIVERYGSHSNLDGTTHNRPRYSSWHTEEKKKLQRARSLLDEKDKYLTEQLRRIQTQPGGRDNSTMSPSLGYRPGSSQQIYDDAWSDRYSNYGNKDNISVSDWEEVRMFSDQYGGSGQTRRATSEMEYSLRDVPMDRRIASPVVSTSMTRRRPLTRHMSDKDEMSYGRSRQSSENPSAYRAYSPFVARQQNGSQANQDSIHDYIPLDDIPLVQRRNIRGSLLSSRPIINNDYQRDQSIASKQNDRHQESLPASGGTNRLGGPLSQMPTNKDSINNSLFKDTDKRTATPELLKKSRNSGFQIRADGSAGATGISYYDPDNGCLSSDGYPLGNDVSKLSVAQSPTDRSADSTVPYTSCAGRRGHTSTGKTEESQNNQSSRPNFDDFHHPRTGGDSDSDLQCLSQTRQATNSTTKPVNAHNNSNNSSIRKSSKIWYQPNMTREEAIEFLKTKSAGAFVVRQSHTFNNSYGLAVKVSKSNPNDDEARNIRHFLIESNSKGVRIRGCANEPYFGSMTALIHQHTLTKLALPCCIVLPGIALESDSEDQQVSFDIGNQTKSSKSSTMFAPRSFVALYLGSIETDSLTGVAAIVKSVEVLLENRSQVMQAEVSIRVAPEGVTLTDVLRKLFFRRHYPLSSISYCGTETTASWDSSETRSRGIVKARIFGFVARKTSANETMCHMLCECNAKDSARSIAHFIAGCIAIS